MPRRHGLDQRPCNTLHRDNHILWRAICAWRTSASVCTALGLSEDGGVGTCSRRLNPLAVRVDPPCPPGYAGRRWLPAVGACDRWLISARAAVSPEAVAPFMLETVK